MSELATSGKAQTGGLLSALRSPLAALKLRYRTMRQFWWRIPFLPRRAHLAGTPEMAAIHRMAPRFMLDGLSRDIRFMLQVLDWVCWPFITTLKLKHINPEVRAAAARELGRSRATHLLQVWWDCVRLGVLPEEYYNVALYRPDLRLLAGDFLFRLQSIDIYDRTYRHAHPGRRRTLDNKAAFGKLLSAHDIAVPKTLAVCRGGIVQLFEALDSPFWSCDLIMKPQKGSNGIGFYRWLRQSDGRYEGALGEDVSLDDILKEVGTRSMRRPILIQKCLINDAASLRFTGGGLASVRVVTGVLPSGDINVIACAVKMPVGNALVDNFMRGNVITQVDIETGRMKPGQYYYQRLTSIDRHPDTQCLFAGEIVPQWAEVKRSAVRAHDLFRTLPVVAFDIAPTEDGPVIIEGNARGDLTMMQYPGGCTIGSGPYPSIIQAYLRAHRDAMVSF